MLVAGHQPNYLPWLGFFHKLASVDHFMIADTVQFVGRGTLGWMHRNKLRTREGWQWLSLPVVTSGVREQTCAEARLVERSGWRRKHWRAIEYNYRNAPHFADYAARFEAAYGEEWTHLTPLAVRLIREIAACLDIATPIEIASERGVSGEAHDLLANICAYYGSNRYLSGVHGRDYLDLDAMRARDIAIEFQQFTHPVYRQCQPGAFEPGMCALDLIFNEGPAAREILLTSSAA